MAVTQILGELKMDAESVVAGLLHDTVEDTDVTFQYIEEVRERMIQNVLFATIQLYFSSDLILTLCRTSARP